MRQTYISGLDSLSGLWHNPVMGQTHNDGETMRLGTVPRSLCSVLIALAITAMIHVCPALADLDEIKARGALRHLGIPYARFVTGSGDGLDVDLIQMFAASLDLGYEFVPTSWEKGFGDLTGKDMRSGKPVAVRGDIMASGITILPWRKRLVSFSVPTFASQVWLMARAGDSISPITPGKDVMADIRRVKSLVRGLTVTGIAYTCLDPSLYELAASGARIRYFEGRLNDLAPYMIDTNPGLALLDAPDVVVALEKWPGQLKVIGPVSPVQKMGAAVAKEHTDLRRAFDLFFETLRRQGKYEAMVERYYPGYAQYFPSFFTPADHTSQTFYPRENRQ